MNGSQTHRVFLSWLIYAAVVAFGFGVCAYYGLISIAMQRDHTQISAIIMGLFLGAEMMAGWSAWTIAQQTKAILGLDPMARLGDLPGGPMKAYVLAVNSGVPHRITYAEDYLYRRCEAPDRAASAIVWLGILGTVLGVILSFWPFLTGGTDTESLRAKLPEFFSGIAVAFIPTALSFVAKIALDQSQNILHVGTARLRDSITDYVERRRAKQRASGMSPF